MNRSEAPAEAWPTEIKLSKDRKSLTVAFDNGETFVFSAEFLRVSSPSAEVQGHSAQERQVVPGKKEVAVLEVHPVGNYAVRLLFDDLHSTGIYSWDYFLEIGRDSRPPLAALSRRTGRQGIEPGGPPGRAFPGGRTVEAVRPGGRPISAARPPWRRP